MGAGANCSEQIRELGEITEPAILVNRSERFARNGSMQLSAYIELLLRLAAMVLTQP